MTTPQLTGRRDCLFHEYRPEWNGTGGECRYRPKNPRGHRESPWWAESRGEKCCEMLWWATWGATR